ncbi:MAG: ankyrin repeat domain-containing protein [Hyphomicrobiales bacterium]
MKLANRNIQFLAIAFATMIGVILSPLSSQAQIAPRPKEIAAYEGLLKAAHEGNVAELEKLIKAGADLEQTDRRDRTAFHIAGYAGNRAIMRSLAKAGADVNALEIDVYDVVTIAAVADDLETMKVALELGNKSTNVTSVYDGTALIAAAHLGHFEVVQTLIKAGAPLDHVNNLHWTALIESVVLGDGGEDHQKTAQALVDAGASKTLADQFGRTPLDLAKSRGYEEMVKILEMGE